MFMNPHPPQVRCIMCEAPMRRAEYHAHLKGCVLIDAARADAADRDARHALVTKLAAAVREEPPSPLRRRWDRL